MITEISPKTDTLGEIRISFEQAHGFADGKWNEHSDATCEKCGKTYRVLVDWEQRDRPKHFYCSYACCFSSLGREEPMRSDGS